MTRFEVLFICEISNNFLWKTYGLFVLIISSKLCNLEDDNRRLLITFEELFGVESKSFDWHSVLLISWKSNTFSIFVSFRKILAKESSASKAKRTSLRKKLTVNDSFVDGSIKKLVEILEYRALTLSVYRVQLQLIWWLTRLESNIFFLWFFADVVISSFVK